MAAVYLVAIFWTLGGAIITFMLAAFIWVGLLVVLRDTTKKEDKKSMLTLALGSEEICSRVATCITPCPRLNTHVSTCPVEDILRYITNGNRIILFIVRKETSGEVEKLIQYIQTQVDLLYASKPVQNRQLYYSLRYAVFGIGDTSEARDDFNRLAMKIDINLRLLGATRVVPLRLYDSTTSPVTVEEEFNEWFLDLAPEAEISGTHSEIAAVGCDKVKPKGILSKKEEHHASDDEEDEGFEFEPSIDGSQAPVRKMKAPIPILRNPNPRPPTPEKDAKEKSSPSPDKHVPDSPPPTGKEASDKESHTAPTSPDVSTSPTSNLSPRSRPSDSQSDKGSSFVSPKANKGESRSPQSSPKSSPKIKSKASPKSTNKSKPRNQASPQSSPKGPKSKSDTSSRAGGKLHGSGVVADEPFNSDDDWEVMEVPTDM
ncbi:uncharacterized protein LOC111252628 [Varroa destructor]|uniref:Flavodoxin-like domain-containing protein n=1 Tax=Varroa destructor TaxID=109461 RepID=A0A7M7KIU9_VARDE|nr:uncharacterized protein LOC111252628 [Varroa destructor]XP_022666577.1 uncharacterized protein LOC111252628 [Varroa destructor]XP_022666578.1 uncharacterized protein LOC111252628 [Varroa destructor]XP_022666579.1 uncharacterized protein LOC111252628 [Varroa destructor]